MSRRVVFAVLWPVVICASCTLFSVSLLPNAVGVGVTVLFTAAAILGGVQIYRQRLEPPALGPPIDLGPRERCPRCGALIYYGDKDTSSGRDLRTFYCDAHCGWWEERDYGVAMWVAMSQSGDPK